REMLEHYGLLPLLDLLVFSDEMQLAKPSVASFETALIALGCDAPEAVFIGDSPAHDVAGARAAGMRTVVIGPQAHRRHRTRRPHRRPRRPPRRPRELRAASFG